MGLAADAVDSKNGHIQMYSEIIVCSFTYIVFDETPPKVIDDTIEALRHTRDDLIERVLHCTGIHFIGEQRFRHYLRKGGSHDSKAVFTALVGHLHFDMFQTEIVDRTLFAVVQFVRRLENRRECVILQFL